MIRLSIAERSGQPKLFTFPKDDITIGRAQGNDIILPRNNISKKHTRVFRKGGKLVVRDLDSTNGTFLNGRRINDDEVLHAGDRIFLADFVLIVEEDESAATPVPPELKLAAPPPLPPDELPEMAAEPDEVQEIDARETIPAEDASEISLAAADLQTAPPDMVLADLAKAAARRPPPEPDAPLEPPMPIRAPEPALPARPARIPTPVAAAPVPARRTAEIPAAAPAAQRPSRPSEPAPAAAPGPSLFDDDEDKTPVPARGRTRGAPAAQPEERPAPAPRPSASPRTQRQSAQKAQPAAKAKAAKTTPTLPEAEVNERLLARVNEVVRLKDAEPAVFGDPELQARIKSAVLDELAILEAEDLIDTTLDRDGLVEGLTSSLFALGPIAAVAADAELEGFVAYPDGVTFERRAGKWRRAERRIDPALLLLIARRLAAGIEGRQRGGSAETFRGRHPSLPGLEVSGALGGSALPGALVRLDRPAAYPADLDRLADAGVLSMPMATFLKLGLESRQSIAVTGPDRAARTAVLRALVAGLAADDRVAWIADPGGSGPPEAAATIVTVTPPSTGEALLEDPGEADGGLADVVQWLQPGVVVFERADPARDTALVRTLRHRLGGVVFGVEAGRWEAPVEDPNAAPGRPVRPSAAGGVDRRLAAAADIVVELATLADGSCRTLRVAEPAVDGGDPFTLNAIFEYAMTGVAEGGEPAGEYRATRVVPRFLERRKSRGKRVDLSLFQ